MWNSVPVNLTPARIIVETGYAQHLTGRPVGNQICGACGSAITHGHSVAEILSDSFGEYADLLSAYLCEYCSSAFKYATSIKYPGKKNPEVQGGTEWPVLVWGVMNGDAGTVRRYSSAELRVPENRQEVVSVMMNPPRGYFFLAAGKSLTNTRGHFLHYGKVNFITDSTNRYYITVDRTVVLVDRNFVKDYITVEKIRPQIVFLYQRKDYLNKRTVRRFSKEFETIERLGIDRVVENLETVKFINQLRSAISTEGVSTAG